VNSSSKSAAFFQRQSQHDDTTSKLAKKRGVALQQQFTSKIAGDQPVEPDMQSMGSARSHFTSDARHRTSALWSCRQLAAIRPSQETVVARLFDAGMGVEAARDLRTSVSMPRLNR